MEFDKLCDDLADSIENAIHGSLAVKLKILDSISRYASTWPIRGGVYYPRTVCACAVTLVHSGDNNEN